MLQTPKTSLANVSVHYLRRLEIPVSKKAFEQQLEEEPSYPSLFSLKTILDRHHVPNEAFAVQPENLDMLEPPFIAYSKEEYAKDFILVTQIGKDHVRYISTGKKEKQVTRKKFLDAWENIILVAEKNEKSGNNDHIRKLADERREQRKKYALISAGTITMILLGSLFFLGLPSTGIVAASVILLAKLSGVALTVILLLFELDNSNSFAKNFCTAGKQVNCEAVLSSNGASIFGIRWNEIGFFYFTSTALFLLMPGIPFALKIPWLATANMLAAPYILYSVYYQWRIVKQWCLLCLAVQFILGVELTWSIINFWQSPVFPDTNPYSIVAILSVLFIPPLVWYGLKPVFMKAIAGHGYRAAYKRLLYDPERFESLLKKQPAVPDHANLGVVVGNPHAATTIVKVCNPYCAPCARAHAVLEEIIATNNNISLKIIFNARNDEKDKKKKPVAHLMAIHSKGDIATTSKALYDWYSANEKNYDAFAAKYPMNGELEKQDEQIEAMYEWCKEAGITGTPTIFINGNKLPDNYSIEELKNIL